MKENCREEIYESDDIAVDKCQSDISSFRNSFLDKTSMNDKDCILLESIKPEDAFQIFNGKLFHSLQTQHSVADAYERRVESPLQRFSRIKAELDDLRRDLDMMNDSKEQNSSSLWSVLQKETNFLLNSVEDVKNHKSMVRLTSNLTATEETFNGLVSSVNSVSLVIPEPDHKSVSSDKDLILLDNRIHRLETVLGFSFNAEDLSYPSFRKSSTASSYPLVDSISRLEQRVSMLDSAHLESLRTKTNSLRADLESTLKTKTSAAASSSELKAMDAARRVEDLSEAVLKVEAVADDLPALLLRLKTLERIHNAAGTFSSRLSRLESDVSDVASDLKSNRDVLTTLKDGLADNLAVMQQNVAAIDHRLEALHTSDKL